MSLARLAPPVLSLFVLALLVLAPVVPVAAQAPNTFAAEKCARYRSATEDALRRWGRDGLSAEFLAAHTAFIAGGCQGPASICPKPGRETDFANALTVRAMNAGMASTFLPWACR
jgi:hypothetical protein